MEVGKLSKRDIEITDNVIEIILQQMKYYLSIDSSQRRKMLARSFKGIQSSPKIQGFGFLPITLLSRDNTSAMTPGDMMDGFIHQIIDRIDNQKTNNYRKDTFSKVLAKNEINGILRSTRGKSNIKKEFPELYLRGRPEIGSTKEKREGFPIVYSATEKVNDLKKLLENEIAIKKISNDLSNCDNISAKFFKSVAEDIFEIIVSGQEPYPKHLFSSLVTDRYPGNLFEEESWQLFREKWLQLPPREKEELVDQFASNFASNPPLSFIFLFGVNEKIEKIQ
jgi:hypothetical protein